MTEETKDTDKKAGPELNTKQKKFLKGLGHSLSPVVTVGKEGLGEKIIKATVLELSRHELIKIKLGKSSPSSKQEAVNLLLPQSESSLVQVIGNTILLFKQNLQMEKDKRIKLP